MYQVLFLCTGNYYRSRYAEILFNRFAEAKKLNCRASSRGLATEMSRGLPGVISPFTIQAMNALRLNCDSIHREPCQLSQEDLARADLVIALKEAEHRPLLTARYAGWEDRVSYWHIHDLDGATPDVALKEVETRVRELIEQLASESHPGTIPR